MSKIKENKARCQLCNDIIESKSVHDYVTCSCGKLSVDGGKDYLKRSAKEHGEWEELSTYEDNEAFTWTLSNSGGTTSSNYGVITTLPNYEAITFKDYEAASTLTIEHITVKKDEYEELIKNASLLEKENEEVIKQLQSYKDRFDKVRKYLKENVNHFSIDGIITSDTLLEDGVLQILNGDE